MTSGGLVYWGKEPVPQPPYKMENQKPFLLPRLPYKYDSNNIAATAYALLACMDHQDNNEPIVMWLNSQRLRDGGWASTQVPHPPHPPHQHTNTYHSYHIAFSKIY